MNRLTMRPNLSPKAIRIVKNPITSRNVAKLDAAARPAKPTRPVTEAYLERAALHYLERYSASVAMLRATLLRRVQARCRLRTEEPAAFAPLVEAVVGRAVAAGLVDDARFAAARAATLRRRGTSARGLAAKLAAKGVPRALVEATLAEEQETEEEAGDAEATAARAYAKRRRIGPWRRPDTRLAHRDRDLAALARAGFPYALARRVIEAEPKDGLPQ